MKNAIHLNGLLLLLGLLLSPALQAAITLSVDRNPVALDESFTLTLNSDESLDGEPDLGWLQREFDLVNQQQSSNFQVINGDVSRSISWTLTLLAKKSGTFAIPPVRIGNKQSNGLTLQVRERAATSPAQGAAAQGEGLFLQLEVDEGPLYVQQQLLYTIKLFIAQDGGLTIGNGSSLSGPELATGEAVIKRLGEDSNYQAEINARRYSVIERRYAIYPQQSGPLSINPIRFDGRMVASSSRTRSIFDTMQQRARIKRISSQKVEREVKPIPAGYHGQAQGQAWLPAKNVQLMEEWPAQQQLVVGEPITRTLALLVDGLTSAQLPTVDANTPAALKSYPDQPLLKETPSAQGITALRQEKIALVATAPGTLTLPAIEVSWWNTESGKQETARLPQRQVTVVAAAGGSVTPPAPPPQTAPPPQPATAAPPAPELPAPAPEMLSEGPWMKVSMVLSAGWLLTLLWWWRSTRRASATPITKPAVSESLKGARKKVQLACQDDSATAAKGALLQWAQLRWPHHSPASLGDIATRVEGELGAAIHALSHSLYGEPAAPWQGAQLWQAFHLQHGNEPPHEETNSELAPLFHHQ